MRDEQYTLKKGIAKLDVTLNGERDLLINFSIVNNNPLLA